jgi:hypothetical protein
MTMPTIAKARQEFTDLLGRAHFAKERIPVTRRDTPYAFIISDTEMTEFEKTEQRNNERLRLARARGYNSVEEMDAALEKQNGELQKLAHERGFDNVDELLALLKNLAPDAELQDRRRKMKKRK